MIARTIEKIMVVVVVVVLGVALAVNVSGLSSVLLTGALIVTVSAGMDLVQRGEARYHPTLDLFILPAALVTGSVLFISLLATGATIVAGLAGCGLLLFAIFWAEFARLAPPGLSATLSGAPGPNAPAGPSAPATPGVTATPDVAATPGVTAGSGVTAGLGVTAEGERRAFWLPDQRTAEMLLSVTGYVSAFMLFVAVYQGKTRSIISAPAIIAISFLIAIRQLRLASEPAAPEVLEVTDAVGMSAGSMPPLDLTASQRFATLEARAPRWPRTLMYAATVALTTGEVTWALNYWPLNGLLGGAFLLAVFYCLSSLFSQHLQRRLTGRLVWEYGVVAAIGALLVAYSGLPRHIP